MPQHSLQGCPPEGPRCPVHLGAERALRCFAAPRSSKALAIGAGEAIEPPALQGETMAETMRKAHVRKNPRSAELYPKFEAVFPTGLSREMPVADPFPLCLARRQGARKWDVDGNV